MKLISPSYLSFASRHVNFTHEFVQQCVTLNLPVRSNNVLIIVICLWSFCIFSSTNTHDTLLMLNPANKWVMNSVVTQKCFVISLKKWPDQPAEVSDLSLSTASSLLSFISTSVALHGEFLWRKMRTYWRRCRLKAGSVVNELQLFDWQSNRTKNWDTFPEKYNINQTFACNEEL